MEYPASMANILPLTLNPEPIHSVEIKNSTPYFLHDGQTNNVKMPISNPPGWADSGERDIVEFLPPRGQTMFQPFYTSLSWLIESEQRRRVVVIWGSSRGINLMESELILGITDGETESFNLWNVVNNPSYSRDGHLNYCHTTKNKSYVKIEDNDFWFEGVIVNGNSKINIKTILKEKMIE